MASIRILLVVLVLVMYAVLIGGTFILAGTWQLPRFWAVFAVQIVIGFLSIAILDEELIRERFRPQGKDEDPWAPIILSVLWVLMLAGAALDVRMHIADNVPGYISAIALVLNAIGWAGFLWAMKVNLFFSSAIRLQPDRAQFAVSAGPYRWIRHPGYAFGALAFITQGVAMGSWLSTIPGVLIVVDLLYRTVLEERMLHTGLLGYPEYAARVRYRWLPGIW